MKANDLTGNHLGSKITVTIGEASVTDTLTGVHHEGESVFDIELNGRSSVSIGSRRCVLTFLRARDVTVRLESDVEIHEAG